MKLENFLEIKSGFFLPERSVFMPENSDYTDFVLDNMEEEYVGYAYDNGSFGLYAVKSWDNIYKATNRDTNLGIRPCVNYSLIKDNCCVLKDDGNYLTVQCGEYPQSRIVIISEDNLCETGRMFTVKEKNNLIQLKEYLCPDGSKVVKRNNQFYLVEPLVWYVHKEMEIAITKNIITGGFAFSRELTINELGDCLMKVYKKKNPNKDEEVIKGWVVDALVKQKYYQDENKPFSQNYIDSISSDVRKDDNMLIEGFLNNIMPQEVLGKEILNKIEQGNGLKK